MHGWIKTSHFNLPPPLLSRSALARLTRVGFQMATFYSGVYAHTNDHTWLYLPPSIQSLILHCCYFEARLPTWIV